MFMWVPHGWREEKMPERKHRLGLTGREEETSVTSPLRVLRKRATGTSSCPHHPAMGQQLRGAWLCWPAGHSGPDRYLLPSGCPLTCLLQLRDPGWMQSLNCWWRQGHPVPSPQRAGSGCSLF